MTAAPDRIFAWVAVINFKGKENEYGEFRQWWTARPNDDPGSAAEYLRLDLHTAALAERDARIAALEAGLRGWMGILANCTIESGVCCCGDDMAGHSNPMNCGHSPVDHGGYVAHQLYQEARALLDGGKG